MHAVLKILIVKGELINMSTRKRIVSKLLLVSAICAITIPSVSYAEEVILSKNLEDYSNLF